MDVTWLQKGHDGYPDGLTDCLRNDAPASLAVIGAPEILRQEMTSLLCSESCPGSLILRTYDDITRLRDKEMAVISGFHSPDGAGVPPFAPEGYREHRHMPRTQH